MVIVWRHFCASSRIQAFLGFPFTGPSWSVLEEKTRASQSARAGWSLSLCLVRVRGLEPRKMEDYIVYKCLISMSWVRHSLCHLRKWLLRSPSHVEPVAAVPGSSSWPQEYHKFLVCHLKSSHSLPVSLLCTPLHHQPSGFLHCSPPSPGTKTDLRAGEAMGRVGSAQLCETLLRGAWSTHCGVCP